MRQYRQLLDWLQCRHLPATRVAPALGIAVVIGLLFGLLEAVQHFIFRHDPAILTIHKVSLNVFWIAPLVTAVLTGSLTLCALAPRSVVSAWPSLALATLISGWVGAYGVVTLAGKIHKGAAALLALGIAMSLWRAVRRLDAGAFLRRTLPACLVALVAIGTTVWASTRLTERRGVQALPPAQPSAPNVLVIVMDTVRADHLSLDGYPRQTTSNIDQWAREGVIFDNAWATSSWTLPSHASLLTGRPTYQHGADRDTRLDGRFLVLPELLQQHGYVTGAFIGNDIWLTPEYGFDRGILRFSVHTVVSDAVRTVWGRKIYATLHDTFGVRPVNARRDAAMVNTELLQWVDAYPDRPFFALVNYFDVHDPYEPPPPFDTRFKGPMSGLRKEQQPFARSIDAYDGLLAYVDTQIGKLRAELTRRSRIDNTIVFILADHGEGLGDHGQPQHGKNLHRSVLRVPLVVVAPGRWPRTARSSVAVSIEQIPSTVEALLGFAPRQFPGTALEPDGDLTKGESTPVLAELKAVGGAVVGKSLISSQWQYIWNAEGSREELYDLHADQLQLDNLVGDSRTGDVRREFRNRLSTLFPDLVKPVQVLAGSPE